MTTFDRVLNYLPAWAIKYIVAPAGFVAPGVAAGTLGWLVNLGFWWPAAVVTAIWWTFLGVVFALLYRDEMRGKEAIRIERKRYGEYAPKPPERESA